MMAKKILFVGMIPFILSSLARADGWPQFRGPSGQNVSTETGFPVQWTRSSNVAWSVAIDGEAWSSPIVWGNRVFVTTATDGGETCHVIALDRTSGSVVWDRTVFKQSLRRKEGRNTFATPTPATDGERVYASFGDGSLVALDFSGNALWTNRAFPFYGQHGLASSPILFNDLLIMARDGSSDGDDKKLGWQRPWDQAYILALDARNGKERWKASRGFSRISHGVPAIWTHDGTSQLVSEAGDVVQGFDLATGERVWSSEVIGEGKVPSTVIGEGMVFTSGGWGGLESIKAFRLGGKGDLKTTNLVWEQKKGMPKVPSMLYVKPYLFSVTDGGVATCLSAGNGDVLWQERLGGTYSSSPVSAEGRVYFLSDQGETTVVTADREFKVLAKNPLEEKVQASPAFSQGHIFIRTQGRLFAIGGK
jgi:outer membrane protein assembly factor BamB